MVSRCSTAINRTASRDTAGFGWKYPEGRNIPQHLSPHDHLSWFSIRTRTSDMGVYVYYIYIRHLPLIRGAKKNQGVKYQWWNLHEMLRSRSCWEAHNLLKSMFCCDIIMPIFLMEMVKLKCWEAGHAEKHKTCWKACFVVKCLFFDGNGET